MDTLARKNKAPEYKDYVSFLDAYRSGKKDDQCSVSSTDSGIVIRKSSISNSHSGSDNSLNSEVIQSAVSSYSEYLESYKTKKFAPIKLNGTLTKNSMQNEKKKIMKTEVFIQINNENNSESKESVENAIRKFENNNNKVHRTHSSIEEKMKTFEAMKKNNSPTSKFPKKNIPPKDQTDSPNSLLEARKHLKKTFSSPPPYVAENEKVPSPQIVKNETNTVSITIPIQPPPNKTEIKSTINNNKININSTPTTTTQELSSHPVLKKVNGFPSPTINQVTKKPDVIPPAQEPVPSEKVSVETSCSIQEARNKIALHFKAPSDEIHQEKKVVPPSELGSSFSIQNTRKELQKILHLAPPSSVDAHQNEADFGVTSTPNLENGTIKSSPSISPSPLENNIPPPPPMNLDFKEKSINADTVPTQTSGSETASIPPPPPPPMPSNFSAPKMNNGIKNISNQTNGTTRVVVKPKDSTNSSSNGEVIIDKNDPRVKKAVYGAMLNMYGSYHDQANEIVSTLPKNMVKQNGLQNIINSIAAQGGLEKLSGRANPKTEAD